MDAKVQDDPGRHRFVILVDGEPGGLALYKIHDDRVIITHSEVDPKFQGLGVGGELARQTLDLLRERGAKVVTACPFFAAYVRKHHEYDDIVVGD